jgi:hypothetical protein
VRLVIQMAHDSYCCQDVQFPSQPFPSPRQNRMFVGWREVGKDGENLTDPCPEKCRPQNLTAGTFAAVDWTFCWWKSFGFFWAMLCHAPLNLWLCQFTNNERRESIIKRCAGQAVPASPLFRVLSVIMTCFHVSRVSSCFRLIRA